MSETYWGGNVSPELQKKITEKAMEEIDGDWLKSAMEAMRRRLSQKADDDLAKTLTSQLDPNSPPTALTVQQMQEAQQRALQQAAHQASTRAMREALDEPTPFVRAARRALPPEDRYKADPEFRSLARTIARMLRDDVNLQEEDIAAALEVVGRAQQDMLEQEHQERRKPFADPYGTKIRWPNRHDPKSWS